MNTFWNEDVSDVMANNGTNEAAIEHQREEAHLNGTCDGGSLTDPNARPYCSALLKSQYQSKLRDDCVRRNARLILGYN